MEINKNFLDRLETIGKKPTSDELKEWIEKNLMIVPKGKRHKVHFRFNETQAKYWETRTNRDYIVKFRQIGMSTLLLGEMFARACLEEHHTLAIIAHQREAAEGLYKKIATWYRNLPKETAIYLNRGKDKPDVFNERELIIPRTNSRIFVGTAGSPDAIRSNTLTMVHVSEVALWPSGAEDLMASIEGALVPDGIIRLETTPKLAGTWAYQTWRECLSTEEGKRPPYRAVFLPWWEDSQYQDDEKFGLEPYSDDEQKGIEENFWNPAQIAWRRSMITKLRGNFRTEYPEDPLSGWLLQGRLVFPIDHIYANWSKKNHNLYAGLQRYVQPDKDKFYVYGVDPAAGTPGGDYSAIQILDAEGEQVAEWIGYEPLHKIPKLLQQLSKEYKPSTIVVERNNHGSAVLQSLMETNLPIFADIDGKLGFLTNQKTKAKIISITEEALFEGSVFGNSSRLLSQLQLFKYDDKDRPGGPENGGDNLTEHDDLVMAWMLANYGIQFSKMWSTPISIKEVIYTPKESQKEEKDFYKETPKEKKICSYCGNKGIIEEKVSTIGHCFGCGNKLVEHSFTNYPSDMNNVFVKGGASMNPFAFR